MFGGPGMVHNLVWDGMGDITLSTPIFNVHGSCAYNITHIFLALEDYSYSNLLVLDMGGNP